MLLNYINKVVLDKDKFPFVEQILPKCYEDVEKAIQEGLKSGEIPQHGMVLYFITYTNINVLVLYLVLKLSVYQQE